MALDATRREFATSKSNWDSSIVRIFPFRKLESGAVGQRRVSQIIAAGVRAGMNRVFAGRPSDPFGIVDFAQIPAVGGIRNIAGQKTDVAATLVIQRVVGIPAREFTRADFPNRRHSILARLARNELLLESYR